MMKKRLFPLIAYMVAFALILSTVCATGVPAFADGEEEEAVDDSEEEVEEEDDGEEDEGIPAVENFRASKIDKKSVELKWDKVDDVDGYEITYNGKTVTTTKTKYKITGLKVKTKYIFKIRAYVFYEEDDSQEEEAAEEDDGIEYEADDEAALEEEEEDSDYEYSEEYAKLTITTLDKNGKGAKTASADSSSKSSVSANGITVKASKIKSVKYDKKKKAVVIKWSKSKNAKKYEIYSSLKKDKGFKKIATVKKGKALKVESKKLKKAGKTYYVKVRAVNGKAYTESAVKSVKIPQK